MNLEPLYSRILVEPESLGKADGKTGGGIYVPTPEQVKSMSGKMKERANKGMVLAVGNECTTIHVGEIVIFGQYAGKDLDHEGKKYMLMNEEDVLCVVR